MKKLLLTLTLALGLNGCATMAAVVGCGLAGDEECEPWLNAAVSVDGRILGAVVPDPRYAPWEPVSVEGVVTSGGAPLHQARAELLLGDELLGIVRTDKSGRYDLREVVEPSRCHKLLVVISHPDLPRTEPIPAQCGINTLDYDFDMTGRCRRDKATWVAAVGPCSRSADLRRILSA